MHAIGRHATSQLTRFLSILLSSLAIEAGIDR